MAANEQTEMIESNQAEAPISVSVMRTDMDEVEQVPLESYVTHVVASEMPTEFEIEALKAQSLAARTYIVQHLLYQDDEEITDKVDHQVYKDEQELREQWGEEYQEKMNKLKDAVSATEGEIITYDDHPITAAYFSTGNGYTENSEDYWDEELPYLRSVESPWDEKSPNFLNQEVFTKDEIAQSLNVTISDNDDIEISRTKSNRVDQVELSGKAFTGREVREKLSLPSSDFTIEKENDHFIFTTKGYGHGIGMSQYGANGMAEEGKTYDEIIEYFYQDIDIQTINEIAPTLVSK